MPASQSTSNSSTVPSIVARSAWLPARMIRLRAESALTTFRSLASRPMILAISSAAMKRNGTT